MNFILDPVYGPFVQEQLYTLIDDLAIQDAITKFQLAMYEKSLDDPAFRARGNAFDTDLWALQQELSNPNGWTFEDNDGSLQRAATSWDQLISENGWRDAHV